ncbi:MAG: hypothetical protein WBA57_16335 [Elainellaceae cyanobacterium]
MTIAKKEREQLIRRISQASGVAQYALQEKMTDEQVIQAADNLQVLTLLKNANHFNRYRQGLKTQEANEKLKAFLNPQHSEILNAGKWLLNALSKSGKDRKQVLLEQELVHKDDYNDTVQGMRHDVASIQESSQEAIEEAEIKILALEKRIDTLKKQLSKIQDYISFNYSKKEWQVIKKTFNLD